MNFCMIMIESDETFKKRAYIYGLIKIALRVLEREFVASNWQVTHTRFAESNMP